jgi:hypothetical protein
MIELDEAYNRNKNSWAKVKQHIFNNYENAKKQGRKYPSKGYPIAPVFLIGDWQKKLKACCDKIGDNFNQNRVIRRFNHPQVVIDEDVADSIHFSVKDFIAVIHRDFNLLYHISEPELKHNSNIFIQLRLLIDNM